MYTIENNRVTFRYPKAVLRQQLQLLSAQLSLPLPAPTSDMTAVDAYALTDDETETTDLLLQNSALTAAEEFDKIGQYEATDEDFSFSAMCTDDFQPHAPKADARLQEWLTWHTLTRWLHLRHLDKPATWTLLQATVAYAALHRELFSLRA